MAKMKLRDELLPNAFDERIDTVLSKIKEIEKHLNNPGKVNELIDELNEFSFRDYDKEYFQNFRQHEEIEDVARNIAQIPPKKINITDAELAEVINRIRNDDINAHFYHEIIDVHIEYRAAIEIIDFPENQSLQTSEDIVHFIKYCR